MVGLLVAPEEHSLAKAVEFERLEVGTAGLALSLKKTPTNNDSGGGGGGGRAAPLNPELGRAGQPLQPITDTCPVNKAMPTSIRPCQHR